jgi:hypothetical protein
MFLLILSVAVLAADASVLAPVWINQFVHHAVIQVRQF